MFTCSKTLAKAVKRPTRKRIEMEWPPAVPLSKCEDIYRREKLLEIFHTEPGLKRHVAETIFKPFDKQSKTLRWYWEHRASIEVMSRSGDQKTTGRVCSTHFFIKEQLPLMEATDPHIWKGWNVVLRLQKKWNGLPIARIRHYQQLARDHNAQFAQ
ncbi:UDP pyrophosphate phosphatase [Perkinsela sp. CCAP 1560/4]|nr:UDP pyrophosphate phosphatase [Perkinsela sp. CCAP 1560/4]|eukprot:KNH08673.1 UDP pyrophosphate phosphatase [Perkinsela sp. CCAP 1560/4]